MHRDTSINTSSPDCQGVYMNIATIFNNMASDMKTELNNARSIGGTITMAEIEELFATLENQINIFDDAQKEKIFDCMVKTRKTFICYRAAYIHGN